MIITILAFIGVLVLLIIAHELGHFITARATGVKVEEFGVGFPPRLFGIRRGETLYSLNAIPLGGFTKMAGEEDHEVSRGLASKSIPVRILVLSAGSLVNFVLPLLLFSIAFMIPHQVVTETVMVKEVVPDSPAARAGIRPGDTILSVNEKPVNGRGELARYNHLNLGKEITLLVQHSDGTTEALPITPRWKPPEGQGALGIEFDLEAARLSQTITSQHQPFWEAIPSGFVACVETFTIFKNEIMKWFTGAAEPAVTGLVGIAQITGEVARAGLSPLLEFAGFLSINLAIINMFPLPALDGGRIVFVLLEWVRRGKRVSPKTEGKIHLIGFALLIVCALLIAYQDIIRIISGESLIP